MNLCEFTALVRLFEACADPAVRRRAMELVPELAEWDAPSVLRVVGDPSEIMKNWPKLAGYGKIEVIDD